MAKYWKKMSDEAIRKYEAEINNPEDVNEDELVDVNVETLESIMNFLDELDWLEQLESEFSYNE